MYKHKWAKQQVTWCISTVGSNRQVFTESKENSTSNTATGRLSALCLSLFVMTLRGKHTHTFIPTHTHTQTYTTPQRWMTLTCWLHRLLQAGSLCVAAVLLAVVCCVCVCVCVHAYTAKSKVKHTLLHILSDSHSCSKTQLKYKIQRAATHTGDFWR